MSLEFWLWTSSAIVIVGVILEEIPLYLEIRENGLCTVLFKDGWKSAVKTIGYFLLIVGWLENLFSKP